MNLDFLIPNATGAEDGAPVARSSMEGSTTAAGAQFAVRGGWNVATGYGATPAQEAAAAAETAGWADVSHLDKLELQGPPASLDAVASACGASLTLNEAVRAGDAWWCRMTPARALIIGDASGVRERLEAAVADAEGAVLVDVSTNFAAMTLVGPQAREIFARFCALDLRPSRTPVRALRPGSIGRQPGLVICEAESRYLFLFGWATGEYMWSVVSDAGHHLGGRPIGADALEAMPISEEESVSA